MTRSGPAADEGEQTFIERLYRSANSYADRLSAEELESIHVNVGIDEFVVEQAEAAGRSSSPEIPATARRT